MNLVRTIDAKDSIFLGKKVAQFDLFDERQNAYPPALGVILLQTERVELPVHVKITHGESASGGVVVVQRDSNLFEIVTAVSPPCRLARRLDGGQENRNQNGDDGNHYQKFY